MQTPVAQAESPYEILRRLENLVRVGTIAQVRCARPARCRVRTGQLLTDWLPWLAARAGGPGRRHWWPPVVGEQCLLIAPGGDLLAAVALPGIYSDSAPQASESATVCRTDWSHTDFMEHDSATGELHIRCEQGISLRVGETTLRLTRAGVFADPDVTGAGRISLVQHLHGGVKPGPDSTGAPQ